MAIMHSLWKNQLRADRVRLGEGTVDAEIYLVSDGQREADTRLRIREIAEAAQNLPEEQRVPLYLIYVEGHSYREVSELLQIPIGTVMSRLSRARLYLADHLKAGRTDHEVG